MAPIPIGFYCIFAVYLLIEINTSDSSAHEWHDGLVEEFQGDLYNNDTLQKDETTEQLETVWRLKSSFAEASAFKYQIGYEDVAIFIGTTKSGKSTLINYLLGNELIGTRESIYSPISIKKVDDSPGPEIGRALASETSIPTRWKSSKMLAELTLWDSPGFEDNRGPSQDITNTFYLKELFMNVKSAKIVLVCDINDILSDRVNSFLSLLNTVEQIFYERFNECFSSIIIAFTKAPKDFGGELVTVNFVSDLLKYKILSSTSIKISTFGKAFLEHLSLNTKQITLFKRAHVGPLSKSENDDFVKAVQSVGSIKHENLVKVSPSIASESKVFLFDIRHNLTTSVSAKRLSEIVSLAFQDFFTDKLSVIRTTESREILNSIQNDLAEIKNQMQQTIEAKSSFHEKMDLLQNINPNFRSVVHNELLLAKSKLMEFIDRTLNLTESDDYNNKLHTVVQSIKSHIHEIITEIQLKLRDIQNKEREQEREKERAENEKRLERMRQEYDRQLQNSKKKSGLFGIIGKIIDNILPF